MVSDLTNIAGLNYEERENAWRTARDRLAGNPTDIRKFQKTTISRYPRGVRGFAYGLLVALFIAAFIPSAISLYYSGNVEFCKILGDGSSNVARKSLYTVTANPLCIAVGGAMVAMAETGQIVFFVSMSVLELRNSHLLLGKRTLTFNFGSTILWSLAILSTFIALVGNAHFNHPWDGDNLFVYFKTFAPPFLVMGIGFVLKELFLSSIREHHETTSKFNEAEAERLRYYNEPELAPNWGRFLSVALREAIVKRNRSQKQREALRALNNDEWAYLLRREYAGLTWSVELEHESKIEVQQRQGEGKSTFDDASVRKEGANYRYWQNPDGTWGGLSLLDNTVVGDNFVTSQNAYHAIYTYNKKVR